MFVTAKPKNEAGDLQRPDADAPSAQAADVSCETLAKQAATNPLAARMSGLRMRLALFQPDIPQNVGACIRLSACFGVDLHVIEPTGFRFDDRAMKRAALDYGPLSHMTRHA